MSTQHTQQFDVEGVTFSTREGVELIHIENIFAKATITTYGATVLSFIPNGERDLLWVSNTAVYDGSKPVRGGIPVCWPWFGGAQKDGLPAHGFVRNMVWQIHKITRCDNGETRVLLVCKSNEETLKQWLHAFELKLCVQISSTLTLTLTTVNLSEETMQLTEALHTYFAVANPVGMPIKGLENSTHLNKLIDNSPAEIQQETVVLNPAKDSVYLNQTADVILVDADNSREIVIQKRNSRSSVVWNPGPEIVKGFADIDDQAWLEFACVESGNVLDNIVSIAPHSEHLLSVQYHVKSTA